MLLDLRSLYEASASAAAASSVPTALLLHCNGTNNAKTFPDTTNTCTVTAQGNVVVSTANPKFGTGAALFDGNSGSMLGVSNYPPQTGDYTYELFTYLSDTQSTQFIFDFSGAGGPKIYVANGFIYYYEDGGLSVGAAQPVANIYKHLAFVRKSGTLTAYYDGVGTVLGTNTTNPGASFNIGQYLSANSYLDEIRFAKSAVYTSNFTPPTSEFAYGTQSAIRRRSSFLITS